MEYKIISTRIIQQRIDTVKYTLADGSTTEIEVTHAPDADEATQLLGIENMGKTLEKS